MLPCIFNMDDRMLLSLTFLPEHLHIRRQHRLLRLRAKTREGKRLSLPVKGIQKHLPVFPYQFRDKNQTVVFALLCFHTKFIPILLRNLQKIGKALHTVGGLRVDRRVADACTVKSSGTGRLDPGVGVLHHQTVLWLLPDKLRSLRKNFRIRFGPGNVGTVADGVKEISKTDAGKNRLCDFCWRSRWPA